MRTTIEENRKVAENMAERLNKSSGGYTALMFPIKGFSGLDMEGQQFFGPEEDQALIRTIKEKIDVNKIEIAEVDLHVNDQKFAELAAEKLLQLIEKKKGDK